MLTPIRVSLLLVCFVFIFLDGFHPVKKQSTLFITPSSMYVAKHFFLGYQELLADLLWLRFLQDADFCSAKKSILAYQGDLRECERGWSYRMADAITNLAPRFKAVYYVASSLMSVFVGDQMGAEHILQKALKVFPKDPKINLNASYFYSVVKHVPHLAAKYAYTAVQNGGPAWLYQYALKQSQEGGTDTMQLESTILQDLLNRDLSLKQKEQILRRLQEIQKK